MSKSRRRRALFIVLAISVALGFGGYLARDAIRDAFVFTFLYPGSRADWDLMQLRREVASGQAQESDQSVRQKFFEIARDNPGSGAEVAAYLFVAKQWPETADADVAYEKLLRAAKNADIGDWARSLEDIRPGGRSESERWRPLAALLIERVRRQPDHPKAARLLCEAAVLIHPDTDVESAPGELHQIAEMIHENYAMSPDLANFCEVTGNLGTPVSWSQPFEPQVRHILEVNQDRFVQCSAHFALASIVRSGGIERQAEARQLYEDFLERFDGETDYRAQSIEQANRQTARRVLEALRLHGLGAPALATTGIDLEGRPIALPDFRGKVVLISFWATWCAPCMRAIPHENELVKHFGSDAFAIVGVNGDKNPADALEAVAEHGISWRSFQNERAGKASIAEDWHVAGWPTYYLLDADGVIARSWGGWPPHGELQAAIGELIEHAEGREKFEPDGRQP